MEEVLHTTELLGDSVVRGGTRNAVPSAEGTRLYSERALLGSAVRWDASERDCTTNQYWIA